MNPIVVVLRPAQPLAVVVKQGPQGPAGAVVGTVGTGFLHYTAGVLDGARAVNPATAGDMTVGGANTVLISNGTTATWQTVGSDKQVIYNNAGALTGATNVTIQNNDLGVGGASLPTTGSIRLADGSTIFARANAVNTALLWTGTSVGVYGDRTLIVGADDNFDIATMATDTYVWGRDIVDFGTGDGTGGATGGGFTQLDVSGLVAGPNLGLQTTNVGTPAYGGGLGVFAFLETATLPTSNPTSGVIMYVQSGYPRYRRTDGTVVPWKPIVAGTNVTVTENAGSISIAASGGSPFVPPTGTGFVTVTGGALDAASLAYPLTIAKGGTNATSFSTSGGVTRYNGTSLVNSANFTEDGSGNAVLANSLSIGSSGTAGTGNIRLQATATIKSLNAGGTTDREVITTNTSDQLILGNGSGWSNTIVKSASGGTVNLRPGANDAITVDGSNIRVNGAIIGDSVYNSPYGCHSEVQVASPGGGTTTLAASEYKCTLIQVGDAITAGTHTGGGGNVDFPTPAAGSGYWKIVYNGCNAILTLRKAGGGGGTVNIGIGIVQIVWVMSGGVYLVSGG